MAVLMDTLLVIFRPFAALLAAGRSGAVPWVVEAETSLALDDSDLLFARFGRGRASEESEARLYFTCKGDKVIAGV